MDYTHGCFVAPFGGWAGIPAHDDALGNICRSTPRCPLVGIPAHDACRSNGGFGRLSRRCVLKAEPVEASEPPRPL
ncbi:MAG: hypothetical protein IJU72_02575 [Bacteroidales bacterium]|nr:hypothetical protein [Bacteroidales bacterium]